MAWAACHADTTIGGSGSSSGTASPPIDVGCGIVGGCVDYSCVTGTVSFAKDVIPIFQRSCNFDSCHASTSAQPAESLTLGANVMDGKMSAADVTAVRDGLVDRASKRSTLKLVAPGDPGKSWLCAKIGADVGSCPAIDATCTPKGCGTSMPQNNPALGTADVVTIVRWVKAGAKND